MRLFPLLAAIAMTACTTADAQDATGIEWELLAIDGLVVDIPATLSVNAEGTLSGKAPCNRYMGRNQASLPDLKLGGVAATRMACDRLDDEQAFFTALSVMTRLDMRGDDTLVLTGPDGRSMEFTRGR
ncbi:META domain-containing protein [Rhodobacter calidifons]|uniref:META domain-containing protein n=1 Tax=Rhodobacter calidifons TaxID=2715277 RepID=A0ABX0G2C9_9RHOB|nr:META domain-containing protein [Rhodobacter calidifons]NHB75127.1 META domain-containing protein [Rhodobacter calidifons]